MNRSEELAKFLGIKPKKEIAMHCGTNCNRHNCIMDRDCEHYKPIGAYPDLTKPSNFVKLLEILTINNLQVVFGTCEYKNTNYYCDIYHYETMTDKNGIIDDLQELFYNIADNPQKAFVSTLLKMFNGDLPIEEIDGKMQENLYNMWEVSICLDYQNVVDKIHEILEKVKYQAQQTDWTY